MRFSVLLEYRCFTPKSEILMPAGTGSVGGDGNGESLVSCEFGEKEVISIPARSCANERDYISKSLITTEELTRGSIFFRIIVVYNTPIFSKPYRKTVSISWFSCNFLLSTQGNRKHLSATSTKCTGTGFVEGFRVMSSCCTIEVLFNFF